MSANLYRVLLEPALYADAMRFSSQRALNISELIDIALRKLLQDEPAPSEKADGAIGRWLSTFPWTHAVTLTPNSREYGGWKAPSPEHGYRLRSPVETFCARLADDIYGLGGRRRAIPAALFFENKTRTGDPTFWHAHGVIAVAEDHCDLRLARKASSAWRRLNAGVGSVDIQPIAESSGGVAGATSYAAKHDKNSDYVEPLFISLSTSEK